MWANIANFVSKNWIDILLVIEIQCAEQLDAIYQNDEKSWREMSITEFVDSLVSKLASVSVS